MLYLLIDIGNSNIKIAYSDSKNIKSVIAKSYSKKVFSSDFKNILKSFKKYPDKIGISCLDTKIIKIVSKIILGKYKNYPYFINTKTKLPIKLDYENTLGSDRISSAVSAVSEFGKKTNILVIDFGTCTTYNFINKGVFSGGLISPGILTSFKSITKFTSLPKAKYNIPESLFSKKTKENISWGIIYQSFFTTEGIVKRLKNKYKSLKVISTGGLSDIFKKSEGLIDYYDIYLVLKGIQEILNYQNKK